MVLAQHRTPEAEDLLFEVLRTDPDPEVKGFALIWLSQSSSERALDAIASILANANEPELQHRAIVALAQNSSPRAQTMLREAAEREGIDPEARAMAIMMLGQHPSAENRAFLRDLYRTLDSPELKARIVHGLAMSKDPENLRWLLDIALSENEPVEVRQQALLMASQSGAIAATELVRLYDGTQNEELRQHLLFAMSQHKDPAAVDKMIAIARSDPNPEMRQRAVMWLSQSKDPRVPDLLMEIIRR
jgi:HEAT repeat protein